MHVVYQILLALLLAFTAIGLLVWALYDKIARFAKYCTDERNSLWIALYLFFVLGGYAYFIFAFFPVINWVHRALSAVAVAVPLAFLYLCTTTDPGFVTSENVEQWQQLYPYDNVIHLHNECKICKLVRPARARHCEFCQRCVARHDHDCPWISNCVGAFNLR
jgi:hypothetical protein